MYFSSQNQLEGFLQRKRRRPLRELVIENSNAVLYLPDLPDTVTELRIANCHNLEFLWSLPQSLRHLHISDCRKLVDLPQFGRSLAHLRVERCPQLKSLPELRLLHNLRELTLLYCDSIRHVPALPQKLRELWINCSASRLPLLPDSLHTLDLDYCGQLQNLPTLPKRMSSLSIKGCSSLRRLPSLPKLTSLCIEECSHFSVLPVLPMSVRELSICGCPAVDRSSGELLSILSGLWVGSFSKLGNRRLQLGSVLVEIS